MTSMFVGRWCPFAPWSPLASRGAVTGGMPAGTVPGAAGAPPKAWRAQQRALSLCPPGDYMDRTLTQLDRADCLARDGDVDGAVTVTTEALVGLTGDQRQGIISTRVRAAITALPADAQVRPSVRDLSDLLVPPDTGKA